ncbi:hypothetical protein [Streptomyces sp. NPDC059016]|uniref:hypothetical protein n=1 Tax=Streptomyces sp. NPDC059016 TaxID=3346699 RepID=UPI003685058A
MTAADLARVDVPAAKVAADAKALADKRTRDGLLAEQRHQYLDLDADSAFTVPGSCCPACPPRTNTGGTR